LTGTQVTYAGVQQLKQSLPKLTIARGQVQTTTQSADKPAQPLSATATDSEKPEQPRYAARTFNSTVPFGVWVQETPSPVIERRIGRTPSVAPLEIPPCQMWGVQPWGPVKDWDLLAREISQNGVPGLKLEGIATDVNLKHLAGLAELRFLNLRTSPITDGGLEHLKGLTGLWVLWLNDARITDAGLTRLKSLTALENLSLVGTLITDSGLEHLKGLTGLQFLNLRDTRITDAGMVHLKGLTSLEWLQVVNTKVTDAGIQQIKQSLPNLTISR
jgi:hypothetical protein